MTKGKRSSTRGDGEAAGAIRNVCGLSLTITVMVTSLVFSSRLTFGSVTRFRGSVGFDSFSGDTSGVTGTGGNTVGKNVSSFGANFAASSSVGNSMATKKVGTSVRTGQLANISRDWAKASEFFLRKLMIDLNCGPGSDSFTMGSTISAAPPLLINCPTLRISPYIL